MDLWTNREQATVQVQNFEVQTSNFKEPSNSNPREHAGNAAISKPLCDWPPDVIGVGRYLKFEP
ncbi:MAG: hypothetical protein C5B50_25040 [Verrucomicrobia bacterium]|nr:MAG: hypothetical protein C5B50_25040 [Verrucomicrobiota bacterium]